MRIAIINDTEGRWFVRRMTHSVNDWNTSTMVYHCDKNLAGPFEDVIDAAHWVIDHEIDEPEGGPVLVKMTADGPKAV